MVFLVGVCYCVVISVRLVMENFFGVGSVLFFIASMMILVAVAN